MLTKLVYRLLLAAALCLVCLHPARAQQEDFGFGSSLNVYTEEPYSKLPLKSVDSVTKIEGPIASTRVVYTFADGLSQTMEVGLNFHLPQGAVLDGFGYYYGSRYIRGKIYGNDQAWQIYTAVTSRGRDPGIMDRPDEQDYHTQIYPVLPKQNLRVIVHLVQMLPVSGNMAHFTLPLQQSDEVTQAAELSARVQIAGVSPSQVDGGEEAYSSYAGTMSLSKVPDAGGALVTFTGHFLPKQDWTISIARPARLQAAVFSRLPVGRSAGAFAATIDVPYALSNPRVTTASFTGARLVIPTLSDSSASGSGLSLTGRYSRPGPVFVTIVSDNHPPLTAPLMLGVTRCRDAENPAAKLWADKRIAALQNSPRDLKPEVVALSRRYTVVSNFTALLAIPVEELARYRRLMAEQAVHTNTRAIGSGGGDPFISVNAPEDARQVVAVFPDGAAKNLSYDESRRSWTTRFDFPLGTPAGDYDVTIIVVRAAGRRTQLILTYSNLTAAPEIAVKAVAESPDAERIARVEVSGDAIAKATVVAPWGERVPMVKSGSEAGSIWLASVAEPQDWPGGATLLSLVCYDGAHNRSEVTVNVDFH